MKKIKVLQNIVYVMLVAGLISVALLVVAGRFGIGGVRALVVESGSMEPAVPVKSVVLTAPVGNYKEGDVVTFRQKNTEGILITHRVVNIKEGSSGKEFITKGDANEKADMGVVAEKDIVGKMILYVPFLGAIVAFAQTKAGFMAFVIIPAVIIVYSEFLNIKKEIVLMFLRRKEKGYEKINI